MRFSVGVRFSVIVSVADSVCVMVRGRVGVRFRLSIELTSRIANISFAPRHFLLFWLLSSLLLFL